MRMVAQIMGIVTVLMFIAPSFNILPQNIGTFLGITAAMLTGTLWAFSSQRS